MVIQVQVQVCVCVYMNVCVNMSTSSSSSTCSFEPEGSFNTSYTTWSPKREGEWTNILLNLILDQYTKPPEDVATTANVLDMFKFKKEAKMLRCKLVLCYYNTFTTYILVMRVKAVSGVVTWQPSWNVYETDGYQTVCSHWSSIDALFWPWQFLLGC